MKLNDQKYRLLGLAFLLQFLTSFFAGILQKAIFIFPESAERTIQAITEQNILFRATLFLDGVTALGVIFLGVMLYSLLKEQNSIVSLTAFAFYILEAAIHLAGKLPVIFLLKSGDSVTSVILCEQTLRVMEFSTQMMMLVFCAGAVLFYYLLVRADIIPPLLSFWGLISVFFLGVWTVLAIFGVEVPFFLYIPYVPFEFIAGIFLLFRRGSCKTGVMEGV